MDVTTKNRFMNIQVNRLWHPCHNNIVSEKFTQITG